MEDYYAALEELEMERTVAFLLFAASCLPAAACFVGLTVSCVMAALSALGAGECASASGPIGWLALLAVALNGVAIRGSIVRNKDKQVDRFYRTRRYL